MANKNKRTRSSIREVNKYEKTRQLRVQENQTRLQDLGVKNIAKSVTRLAQSEKMKKKTEKQNAQAGDADYIPDTIDDSDEDYQQVVRRSVSKKPKKYIPPMSTNRASANLRRQRRVIASNVSQKVPSTSNVTKPIMSEIVESNKGRTKRRMVLADEDDEIFQNNGVDDVDQDDEYENNAEEQLQGHDKEIETGERAGVNSEADMEEKRAPKRVRTYTRKTEIWNMKSTERMVVTFNEFGKPVGDEGKELVQYLGTLVRMPEHVSVEYSDWRKVPMLQKEEMYSLVKSKFTFAPAETSQIKKWIIHSMGKQWRTWKGKLKSRGYDPSLTIDEIVARQTSKDDRVNPAQFKELVTRWFTSEFQNTCAKKRLSRSKMKEPHVTGSKSFARLAHEVAMKNDGVYPTRGEMYIKTRTRKDGSILDEEAASVVTSLKAIANGSTSTPGDPNDFTNDDYAKVKGPEKRGYVRLVGRMPSTKSNGESSSNSQIIDQIQRVSQTIDQLQGAFNVMINFIQEHIPNADLSTVLKDMNLQVPRTGSSASNNSLAGNESGGRSDL